MAPDPAAQTSTELPHGGAFRERWNAAAFQRIGLHVLSFYVPSLGFLYVLTGPHPGWQPLLFLMNRSATCSPSRPIINEGVVTHAVLTVRRQRVFHVLQSRVRGARSKMSVS